MLKTYRFPNIGDVLKDFKKGAAYFEWGLGDSGDVLGIYGFYKVLKRPGDIF